MKIFGIEHEAKYKLILVSDVSVLNPVWADLNRRSMVASWEVLSLLMGDEAEGEKLAPDISLLYIAGALVFRESLKDKIFPAYMCEGLEFLPCVVGRERWYLLNCLQSVSEFDNENSNVLSDRSGEIFFINKLVIRADLAEGVEIFALGPSNRSQLFVLPSFVARVKACGAKGIKFREIGQIIS